MKKLGTVGNVLRWLFGIIFLIGGLSIAGTESMLEGIFLALFGFSLLPFFWKLISHRKKYPKWIAAVVPIVLFVMASAAAPTTDAQASSAQSASVRTDSADDSAVPTAAAPTAEKPAAPAADTPAPAAASATASETEETAGEMTVHFLDVGQGLAILVQSDGQTLVYDGGDRDTSSFVVSYLKDQGVSAIDYLISSHYDSDHVSGLIGCLNAFDVKNVISSDYVHDSKTYESFISAVEQEGLTPQHPSVGTEFSFGTGTFTILSPDSIDTDDSNSNSVAIKLTNGANSFIFTGDAENSSESDMCRSGIDLSCDVLVPGHHGSATATSWDFLQATVPEYAVISCGTDNQYGHPDKDTMDKLESMDIQVYRTDKQGTIVAVSDGTTITWSQEPCNDYTPGDSSDTGTQPASDPAAAPVQAVTEAPTQAAAETPAPTAAETPAQAAAETPTQTAAETPAPTVTEAPTQASAPAVESTPAAEEQVWVSATGEKYHNKPNCGRMNPDKARQMSRSDAEAQGLEPCSKCF